METQAAIKLVKEMKNNKFLPKFHVQLYSLQYKVSYL